MRFVKVVAALLLFLGAGCSGLKTYPTGAGGNLAVQTQVDSGVRAALHIHRVDDRCRTEYRGSVALDRASLALALPPGQSSYLVVTFDTSSFLGGERSTSTATLLAPRPGARYTMAVRYRDDIYDVSLRESDASGRRQALLPARALEECRGRAR